VKLVAWLGFAFGFVLGLFVGAAVAWL